MVLYNFTFILHLEAKEVQIIPKTKYKFNFLNPMFDSKVNGTTNSTHKKRRNKF